MATTKIVGHIYYAASLSLKEVYEGYALTATQEAARPAYSVVTLTRAVHSECFSALPFIVLVAYLIALIVRPLKGRSSSSHFARCSCSFNV